MYSSSSSIRPVLCSSAGLEVEDTALASQQCRAQQRHGAPTTWSKNQKGVLERRLKHFRPGIKEGFREEVT